MKKVSSCRVRDLLFERMRFSLLEGKRSLICPVGQFATSFLEGIIVFAQLNTTGTVGPSLNSQPILLSSLLQTHL
jgi:hypothetical protein